MFIYTIATVISIVVIIIITLLVNFCHYKFCKKYKKTKIDICNKIARLQYNRINNPDYLHNNPLKIFADDILENSLTVIDKIV